MEELITEGKRFFAAVSSSLWADESAWIGLDDSYDRSMVPLTIRQVVLPGRSPGWRDADDVGFGVAAV